MNNEDLGGFHVTITMVTYNHEKFIEQAIESVMMQEAAFKYKLLIGEDYSTDNTRQICIKMKQKYPDKIELFLNEKNLGAALNGYNMLNRLIASGSKYAGILDGDDYWIDKKKLQKQVDILERNGDLSLCFTRANILNESTGKITAKNKEDLIPDLMNFDTFVEKGNPYNTCTTVFRVNRLSNKNLDWYSKVIKQDWAIYVMLLATGDAYFLRETAAVYRVHGGGIIKSTNHIKLQENSAFLIESLQDYFLPKQYKVLGIALTWNYFHLAFDYWNDLKPIAFLKNIKNAAQTGEPKSIGWYWLVLKRATSDPLRKVYHKIRG